MFNYQIWKPPYKSSKKAFKGLFLCGSEFESIHFLPIAPIS